MEPRPHSVQDDFAALRAEAEWRIPHVRAELDAAIDRIEEQLEALQEVERLARELIELDAWAFIGWEPSGERKDAIENTFASLTEKLTGLDVRASTPASRPDFVADAIEDAKFPAVAEHYCIGPDCPDCVPDPAKMPT